MTVAEFIEKLKELPQDHQVIMSKDGEGNSYSPFSDFGLGMYIPDSTWSGDFYGSVDAEEIDGYEENAICLWPTN